MKLSMEGFVPCAKLGYREGMKSIKDAGFDCVDMSYYWLGEDAPALNDGYREFAIDLRSYLDEIGLECNQAHAPFDFAYGMEQSESEPTYLAILRSIESAAILGAKQIVIHSINPHKELVAGDYTCWDYNLEFYKKLLPVCEKHGIRLAVENLFIRDRKRGRFGSRFNDPRELCDFLLELDSPYATACVDVGHAALVGWEPENFIAGMDKELLGAFHIQDGDYLDDRHTLPYLGSYNWRGIADAIKAKEYRGELTLEIWKFLKDMPPELIGDALQLVSRVGRQLISMIEE